jgi:hypothetical protein
VYDDDDDTLTELTDHVMKETKKLRVPEHTTAIERRLTRDAFLTALKTDIKNPRTFATHLVASVMQLYMEHLTPPLHLEIKFGAGSQIHILDAIANSNMIYVTKLCIQHYVALHEEDESSTAGTGATGADAVQLVGVVYSKSEPITNFETLFDKTANSLFVYNENFEQYNDPTDIRQGAGNGVMRAHRLEQWKEHTPDGISNGALGIPTNATDDKIIDDSTTYIERTLNENPHVKYVFFSMDGKTNEIGIQTFVGVENVKHNATYATAKLRNMVINGKKIVESDAIRNESDFDKLVGTFGDPKPMKVLERS